MPYLDELRAMGGEVTLRYAESADGFTVGKLPPPDNTVSISADFYLMACRLGSRK